MKQRNRARALLLAALVALSAAAWSAPGDDEILYWTCGMHPSVRAEEPGKCPICNMDLVPVTRAPEAAPAGRREIELTIDPYAARLARIRTVEVARMALVKTIRAPGELTYDETRSVVISSRVNGWIERLHADYAGMTIEAGEPLAEIYSPDLVTAQKEFLLARGTALEKSAREKLLLLGVTPSQIGELESKSAVETVLPVLAERSGTVVHRSVSEGDYVKRGQALFHVSDLSRLWVLADIFDEDLGHVEIGQTAVVTSGAFPGEEILAQVAFIDPSLDVKTRSAKVRLEIHNEGGRLRPGTLVDVALRAPLASERGGAGIHEHHGGVLAVPRSAVIDTGTRSVAFVEIEPGRYQLRNVRLGASTAEYYVVLAGLEEGERVVEKGSFLLDSQTQLTGEAEEIYGGALGKESEKADSEPRHNH